MRPGHITWHWQNCHLDPPGDVIWPIFACTQHCQRMMIWPQNLDRIVLPYVLCSRKPVRLKTNVQILTKFQFLRPNYHILPFFFQLSTSCPPVPYYSYSLYILGIYALRVTLLLARAPKIDVGWIPVTLSFWLPGPARWRQLTNFPSYPTLSKNHDLTTKPTQDCTPICPLWWKTC